MRLFPYRPLALGAVSLLALFGLSAAPAAVAGASTSASPAPSHGSAGSSLAAKAVATVPVTPSASRTLPSGVKQACAAPTRVGEAACMLFVGRASAKSGAKPDVSPVLGAYAPADLQSAYNLTSASAADGTGETVALVDAYADPNLAGDLSAYRAEYGLPPCTTSNGCFGELNEHGGTSLPTVTDPTGGWEAEQAADVEMVSAICPNCKILMVEANSSSINDLGTAEITATDHASFVSNSWGILDVPGYDSFYDSAYFNHPGVAITAAAGDFGYGAAYPASSQLVTSVGGTYLTQTTSNSRGWAEQVWDDQPAGVTAATQSSCSAGEGKPSWQTDPGCANRTQNDVSAVASGPDGISIYDSFDSCVGFGSSWCPLFGTSLASPIIAAVYALANSPSAMSRTYPSSYVYESGQAASLYPVASGSDGSCESNRLYLCDASDSLSNGYNGPAGWGTPNGITAFRDNLTTKIVSVYNPGAVDIESGIGYSDVVTISALDSAQLDLTYSASNLPAGLVMGSTGVISGSTTAVGTHTVTVTVSDSSGVSSTVSFTISVAPSLDSAYHPGTGAVHLDWDGKCLDDTGNSSNNGNKIQIWACDGGPGQNWTFYPDTDPGDANLGELTIHGKCLDIVNRGTANGSRLQLWSCTGGTNQQWYIAGQAGELISLSANKCIDDPYHSTTNGTQLDIWNCNDEPWQAWTPAASPVVSGIAGKCMDDTGGSNKNGNKIQLYSCNGEATQRWTIGLDGSIQIDGKCLDATGYGTEDGTKIQLYSCTGNTNQEWIVSAYGMLENINAEKCLADPNDTTTNGTQLVLEDCYGNQGEIWSES